VHGGSGPVGDRATAGRCLEDLPGGGIGDGCAPGAGRSAGKGHIVPGRDLSGRRVHGSDGKRGSHGNANVLGHIDPVHVVNAQRVHRRFGGTTVTGLVTTGPGTGSMRMPSAAAPVTAKENCTGAPAPGFGSCAVKLKLTG